MERRETIDTFYITGTRRGLGKRLAEIFHCVDNLRDCDTFINCKHDGFSQVEQLYEAAGMHKRIINIGSNSPDQSKKKPHVYQVEKYALDKANEQLFYQGVDTTIVRFGYFDSPRVQDIAAKKMSIDDCVDTIRWVLSNKNRVKEITICP